MVGDCKTEGNARGVNGFVDLNVKTRQTISTSLYMRNNFSFLLGSSKSKPKPKFKLLLALLALFWIGLPAYAASDKVSINMKDVPLKNVLKSIERQTDYRFFYSKESINVNEKVSVKVAGGSPRQSASFLRHRIYHR